MSHVSQRIHIVSAYVPTDIYLTRKAGQSSDLTHFREEKPEM